ncbi:hypothetical protein KDL44_10030 [bacterium]|nr:hypothetical protein [bacterium]
MSRLIVILFAIAALFATGSCVPSVHGIATESNIIYRPELVGSWVSDDNSAAWVFSSVDELHYMLELVTQDGTDGLFNVALVELEGELFLDMFPSDQDFNWPLKSYYGLHFMPMHTFMHAELSEDGLALRMMDPSWLDAKLSQEPGFTPVIHENMTALTGSTAELQALLPQLLSEAPIPGGGFMGGDASPFTEAVPLIRGELTPMEGMDPAEFMEFEDMEEMEPEPVEDAAPVTAP